MDKIFIQTHIIGQEKIFLLISIRDYNRYNLCRHVCESKKTNPPLGPPPPQSYISRYQAHYLKESLGRTQKCSKGTKGYRLKRKFQQQWTIVSLLSISLYAFNVPRGSLYSFTRDNEGLNPSDLKAYGRPGVI